MSKKHHHAAKEEPQETVEEEQETPSVPVDSTNINDFDSTIDNGMFYTKVDNIYVMLYTALMFNDLSLLIVNCQLSTVNCQLSIVNCQLFWICTNLA